jgi:YVTN family beta-propeller protein
MHEPGCRKSIGWLFTLGGAVLLTAGICRGAGSNQPLVAQAPIALPNTSGRIDHMAIDLARKRLFVAELGNGSVDVIDLASRTVIKRISGLHEPQGVVYAGSADILAVASGGDGTVRTYDGGDLLPRAVIELGDDADNARVDPRNGHILMGYGSGGIAIIDPTKPAVLSVVALPAHPEGFVVAGNRAYVNVPNAGQIDVIDLDTVKLIAKWAPSGLSSNYPMAMDDAGYVAVVFRGQDRFVVFDPGSGHLVASVGTCGDADDISFDAKRRRFLVSCGAGAVDVLARDAAGLRSLGRVATARGARTSLFVPELDRLFVAERGGPHDTNAAIATFCPADTPK